MAAPTPAEIERILHAIDTATWESDYVDSIRMEEEQISGTRYKIILNDEPASER